MHANLPSASKCLIFGLIYYILPYYICMQAAKTQVRPGSSEVAYISKPELCLRALFMIATDKAILRYLS